jgi:hypothetical protein
MLARMSDDKAHEKNQNLVERNPDGTFTKETLARAMKAFHRRLKLTRLDAESKLGHDPMTRGEKSGLVGVRPPEQYPREVWDALVAQGRLRHLGQGIYEGTAK